MDLQKLVRAELKHISETLNKPNNAVLVLIAVGWGDVGQEEVKHPGPPISVSPVIGSVCCLDQIKKRV